MLGVVAEGGEEEGVGEVFEWSVCGSSEGDREGWCFEDVVETSCII